MEGHQHEGGVVHIGIKIISELEGPTARRRIGVFDLPVAAAENLVLEKPSDGFLQSRIGRRDIRFHQRKERNCSVPHRRQARLESECLAVFDLKARKLINPARG